jgi:signal transduction histidine kinase
MKNVARGPLGRPSSANKMRDRYSEVLLKYLDNPGQAGLAAAQQFGQKAMDQGLDLGEMAEIHHQALGVLLTRPASAESASAESVSAESASSVAVASGLKAAGTFFAASMLPFTARHGQSVEAIAALRHMNGRLEDQAGRISHAIYDEPLQLVAAAHLALSAPKDQPGYEQRLSAATVLLNQIEVHLTALSQELHPCVLDHLGLDAAADWLAGYFNRMAGTDIVVEGSMRMPLSAPVARVLYRSIEESLTNIAAHAQAKKVFIQLQQAGKSVTCAIRDEGVGFDHSAGLSACGERGVGLIDIRERVRAFGGSMTVNSSLDTGTELIIVVPVHDEGRIPAQASNFIVN